MDQPIARAVHMRGGETLGAIAVPLGDGGDERQMLGVDLRGAAARQARESAAITQLDLVAQALQQSLQLDRARGLRDRTVERDRGPTVASVAPASVARFRSSAFRLSCATSAGVAFSAAQRVAIHSSAARIV
jgi:hypothetical protein